MNHHTIMISFGVSHHNSGNTTPAEVLAPFLAMTDSELEEQILKFKKCAGYIDDVRDSVSALAHGLTRTRWYGDEYFAADSTWASLDRWCWSAETRGTRFCVDDLRFAFIALHKVFGKIQVFYVDGGLTATECLPCIIDHGYKYGERLPVGAWYGNDRFEQWAKEGGSDD